MRDMLWSVVLGNVYTNANWNNTIQTINLRIINNLMYFNVVEIRKCFRWRDSLFLGVICIGNFVFIMGFVVHFDVLDG